MSSNRSPRVRARLRACCTVQFPVGCAVTPPRCIRRLPCSMNTSTYMRFSSTVSTCRKSTARMPVAWAVRNCRHVGPDRRGPGSMPAARQDLPHGGRRHGDAELGQLAMDPAMSPQRILLRQANHQAGDARDRRRAPRVCAACSYRTCPRPASLRCQARSVAGRHGEDPGPAPAGQEPCHRGEPHPVARLVPYPADVSAQHRILVPEHEQLGILRPVTTERQDGQAE